ncbi:DUF3631 domain-containing protein [Streptomyces sp. LARHCF252]
MFGQSGAPLAPLRAGTEAGQSGGNETAESFRSRLHEPQGRALRQRLAAWADTVHAARQILAALNAMDETPWADVGDKPLDSRQLAKPLVEYVTANNTPI